MAGPPGTRTVTLCTLCSTPPHRTDQAAGPTALVAKCGKEAAQECISLRATAAEQTGGRWAVGSRRWAVAPAPLLWSCRDATHTDPHNTFAEDLHAALFSFLCLRECRAPAVLSVGTGVHAQTMAQHRIVRLFISGCPEHTAARRPVSRRVPFSLRVLHHFLCTGWALRP